MGPCQSSNAGRQGGQTSSSTTSTRPNNKNPSSSKKATNNNSSSKKSKSKSKSANVDVATKKRVISSNDEKAATNNSRSNNNSSKDNNKPRIVRSKKGKIVKSAALQRKRPSSTTSTSTSNKKKKKPVTTANNNNNNEYSNADPSKWIYTEHHFNGDYMGQEIGFEEEIKGKSILEGIKKFKSNPSKYVAMMYQTSSKDWSPKDQTYILIHRHNTIGFKPTLLDPKNKKGWMTLLLYQYQTLKPFPKNVFPAGSKFKDKYTDNFVWKKRKLHNNKNLPILPGRGMGIGDTPNLKIIGDVDPSDIHQGYVNNCWLLSGISSLAEFDGAIKRLFRKTKDLYNMPMSDRPNMYTITLWDLQTWKEVDIVVDERLCSKPGPSSTGGVELLGAKPSEDGELWVCYLEKALAAHCGGWDKISGGQCTHAWALLTGCKEQYTIRVSNPKSGKYGCFSKYNTTDKCWAKHCNSPHDGDKRMWRSAWPKVGGGGNANLELTQEELFMRMCAWDDTNYIVGAGIRKSGGVAAGLVDDHAYSVIECLNDVAGTPIDLIKVRNPWGEGEIEDGEFDDDGPGWDKWPQIKAELNPVVADDGIFWVTKQEFFKFFGTIFLSASNMTEFLED